MFLHLFSSFLILSYSVVTYAATTSTTHAPNGVGNFAVKPTKPGQIGVTPVDDDLGGQEYYRGLVQSADTNLITAQDGTTTVLFPHPCTRISAQNNEVFFDVSLIFGK
jgi:hypothetical protein